MQTPDTPPRLPPRLADAHKASVGRVLVIGGSPAMAGAPALAGLGALRGGAGLVKVAVPEGIQDTVASFRPETTTLGLPQTRAGALGSAALPVLRQLAEDWDAIVLGPGLGRDPSTLTLVRTFLRSVNKPLVLDADALFAFAADGEERMPAREAPTVITPHEGEAGRLLGISADDVRADRDAAVKALAETTGAIAVLKGPNTLVHDGARVFRNGTGGPVLAAGGTGDVLAGLIAALLASGAQSGLEAFDAVCLGVHAHGAAADRVAGACDRGFLASELAAGIPEALHALSGPAGA